MQHTIVLAVLLYCSLSLVPLTVGLITSPIDKAMVTYPQLLKRSVLHARQWLRAKPGPFPSSYPTATPGAFLGSIHMGRRSFRMSPLRMQHTEGYEFESPVAGTIDVPDLFNHLEYASEEVNLDHILSSSTKVSQIHPYWIEQLKLLDRPAAKSLIPKLLPSNPLGYELASGVAKKGSLMDNMIQWKRQHVDKVILTRVGEFYETTGVDALMLVNYAGLNPMGGGVRAGCPIKNIQATLDSLTQAGLSVAVYEEIAEIDPGRGSSSKAKLKSRVLSQIVSPASSTYIYDNMCLRSDDIEFRENRPAVGVMRTVNGFTLCQIHLDTSHMSISERLTEEGVRSLLASTGHIEPIYTQDCSTSDLSFLTHIAPGEHTYEKMTGYSEADFPQQVLRRLSRRMEINVDNIRVCNRNELNTQITNSPTTTTKTTTSAIPITPLMPIYTSTALQIGLIANNNVPDLIPALLPTRAGAYSNRFLRKWLLNPPPAHIADCMRSLCEVLMHGKVINNSTTTSDTIDWAKELETAEAVSTGNANNVNTYNTSTPLPTNPTTTTTPPLLVPRFTPVSIAKVVTLINANQCNVALFREIRNNVNALQLMLQGAHTYRTSLQSDTSDTSSNTNLNTCTADTNASGIDNDLSALVEPLLTLTSYESGIKCDYTQLLQETASVLEKIDYVIPSSVYTEDTPFVDPHNRIPSAFFEENEKLFRNKLLSSHPEVCEIYNEVKNAAVKLSHVVNSDFAAGYLVQYDINNNAVVLRNERAVKSRDKNKTVLDPFPTHYSTFIDRKGVAVKKSYTTTSVNEALQEYITCTTAAEAKVSGILQQLSIQLQGRHLISIVQAAHWAVILETVTAHSVSARQKGWTIPTMVDFPVSGDSVSYSDTVRAGNGGSSKKDSGINTAYGQAIDTLKAKASNMDSKKSIPPLTAMHLTGLSPYWMDRVTCTLNHVHLQGIFLLTAPNMSGKSTFMRSAIVAALLGNCGLCVPCSKAEVPRYDHYFLRTASYDVPSEAKSAFALEMDDLRVMLRDSTDRSLVMIDELGKGTSAKDGSALSGALLEHLDRKNITGVFATHLHELFLLPLQLRSVRDKKMGYATDSEGHVRWNYQLEDGRCTDSMALVTARQYGIDVNIVQRAAQLADTFDKLCRPEEGSGSGDSGSSYSYGSSNGAQGGTDSDVEENEPASSAPSLLSLPNNIVTKQDKLYGRRYNLNTDVLPIMRQVSADASSNSNNYIQVIPAAWEAPVALEGSACVYVLQLYSLTKEDLPDLLYVGETESIRQRLKQHRDKYKALGYSFNAAVLKVQHKSAARKLETMLINALKGKGLDIENDADSKHVLFSGGANN